MVDTCPGCHHDDDSCWHPSSVWLLMTLMTGYFDSDEASCLGNSLKQPSCLRVSEPSGSLTYQFTGWNVSPACLVMTPCFPLCAPLTVIRTFLPTIFRSRARYCSCSDKLLFVGTWACRLRASCSSMLKEERRPVRASISASSSSVDFLGDDMSGSINLHSNRSLGGSEL